MGDKWVTFPNAMNERKSAKQRRKEAGEIARAALLALKGSSEKEQAQHGVRARLSARVKMKSARTIAKEQWCEHYKNIDFIRHL